MHTHALFEGTFQEIPGPSRIYELLRHSRLICFGWEITPPNCPLQESWYHQTFA